MQVTYFQRRRRHNANFSLEFIFDDVRTRLNSEIQARVVIAPFFSNGLFRRLGIAFWAWWNQAGITHVTGDINFAAIPLTRHKTVLTILDCGFLDRTRGLRRTLLKLLWLTWPVRSASLVTAISVSAREEILRHTKCDPAKLVVIPVAISDQFRRSPRNPDFTHPRILLIGTAPNKNIPRILRALKGVACRVAIIGKIHDDISVAIAESAVDVENFVNLSQEEIVDQYEKCDMIVFASLVEGFGMPIVEAQQVGRPVVTSNLSSMPEVAGDGACLVNPHDVQSIREGILRVISDADYRQQLLERGFENAKRFDAEQIAGQYLAVYQQLERAIQS